MNYKKIIRSQRLRFRILQSLSWVPDSFMIRIQYRIKTGRWPNLKHPRRFTEKLQVYKMKYRNPLMHQCVDKFEVRKYVESKGLGYVLNDLYGIYDKAEDIDFKALPDKFVVKSTSGGGGLNVIIVKDKKNYNLDKLRNICNDWVENGKRQFCAGREWAYTGIINTKVVIEKLLMAKKVRNDSVEDFKFFCFNGKFRVLCVDKDRFTNHTRGFWDENLNYLTEVVSDHHNIPGGYKLPVNIKDMITIAEILAEEFPFVRVDLYNVDGKIYFGELTFYPWSGYVNFNPDSFDCQLGKYLTEYH